MTHVIVVVLQDRLCKLAYVNCRRPSRRWRRARRPGPGAAPSACRAWSGRPLPQPLAVIRGVDDGAVDTVQVAQEILEEAIDHPAQRVVIPVAEILGIAAGAVGEAGCLRRIRVAVEEVIALLEGVDEDPLVRVLRDDAGDLLREQRVDLRPGRLRVLVPDVDGLIDVVEIELRHEVRALAGSAPDGNVERAVPRRDGRS